MNLVFTQQVAFKNALVALEKRLKIKKCNARIEFSKPQREETYQVTSDAHKLSPCYLAFLITAEELSYSGKCDMLSAIHTDQMHSLGEHLLLSSIGASLESHQDLIGLGHQELKSYGMYGALIPNEMINQDIKDSKAYKTYLDFATRKATPKKARKLKKVASPSKKLSLILEELAEKPKRAKKPAKKSTTMPTTCVVTRDTPGVSASKKKAPTKKSKQKTHKLYASGSSDGVGSQPKVPDEQQDMISGTKEGTGTIPGVPDNDDEEKEYEEEYVRTRDNYEFTDDDEEYEELYKDVNVRLKDAEHEEERKGDVKMTDAGRDDGT
uniref:Uncharacterized protein n=1 Tax=Tanacetum cinerariifolium TaxID=118510 RepID=A0A6L2P2I1_TANCI|nr:hypothetical protein [Tanacetum cinerariifolium]